MISHNKEDKEINKINYYSTSIPPTPYQKGECADDKKNNESSLPLGGEDSTEAEEVPKRKVAPKEKPTKEPWRESFDEYMKLVNEGAAALKADAKFRAEVERLQPNIDYDRTIDNCVLKYWGTETGWEKKRKSRTKKIDMKMTLRNSFDMNKLPKERPAARPQTKRNDTMNIDY